MDLLQQFLNELYSYQLFELIAVVLAIIYVVLASREIIWCWPAGILSSLIFVFIFFKVNYQLEALLNIFYVIIGLYGWWEWGKGIEKKNNKAKIDSYSIKRLMPFIIIGCIFSISLGYVFQSYFGSDRSYLDAFTTVFAILTTWMVTRKILENWLFWIFIDFASIYLYIQKGLFFTVFLFIVYIVIAVYGYIHWKKVFKDQRNT